MRPATLACALFFSSLAFSQDTKPILLTADLTDAPRKLLHAHLTFAVQPGPLTLLYPEWIPGEHSPSGPISDLAGLVFTAGGQRLPWHRDDVDMYAIKVVIPPGATKLEAQLDFLATAPPSGFSAGASTTANLALLSWNEVLLYPAGLTSKQITFTPSVKLPEGWRFGTALTTDSAEGTITHFHPVTLNVLVDSPVLAGRYFKEVPLAPDVSPKHYLDMAADGPEDLEISKEEQDAFSKLVRETGALYRSRHYDSYHFLLTLSDETAHFGLEHHQSSDDRVDARTLVDDDLGLLAGDLLPHEFTHSWNGKYRRPAGLVTTTFQQPMKGELLWVYEGLTQYLGDVLAARSGIWDADDFREHLAASAADLDHRPGRTWRDLQDTATAAQILYTTPRAWDNWRRTVDYYPEGELIWLEADTLIRQLSKGHKSLDDFCVQFLAGHGETGPQTAPYTFDDVVAAINKVQPYHWAQFFRERLDSKADHAPLGGILNSGYKLEYNSEQNDFIHAEEEKTHGVDAWFSLGLSTGADNVIGDVLIGSPAYQAGLGPDMKIIAVNSRRANDQLLHDAIRTASSGQGVDLIVDNSGNFKVVKIAYNGGERYPHLVRTAGTDMLDQILKPREKQ